MPAIRLLGRLANAALTAAVAVVLAAVLVLSVAQRLSSTGSASLFGTAVLSVLSGSMTPHIDTGDVVVDHRVSLAQAEHLRVGQIITYRTSRYFGGRPVMITHRIVGILTLRPKNLARGPVQRLYVTKGDANTAFDPHPVAPAQVVGVFWFRVPRLGYLAAFVRTPAGFAGFIVLPVVYLIGGEFLRLWRRLDAEERRHRLPALPPEGGDPPR